MLLLLAFASTTQAGRNSGGALVVHTNDMIQYTTSGDYCGVHFDNPGTCEDAITRTDKDEETPAVIWLLAAFPDTSSPAVTTIQFGIDHNLPPEEGYFAKSKMCADLEMPDAGWPETGFGNLVSFGSSAHTELLFPYYFFAAYGFEGAYLGTTVYPATEEAKFVDESTPPVEDVISAFGVVRWGVEGENDCPPGSEQDGAGDDPSGEDAQIPDGGIDIPEGGGDSLEQEAQLAYVRLATATDSLCFQVGDDLQGDYGFRYFALLGPDALICNASPELLQRLAADPRVAQTATEPVPVGPQAGRLDTRRVWNAMLAIDPDSLPGTEAPSDTLFMVPEEIRSTDYAHTSTYLIGKVVCQIILMESLDSGECVAPDYIEDWEDTEPGDAVGAVVGGHRFAFEGVEPRASVQFVYPSPIIANTSYEPIQTRKEYHYLWRKEFYVQQGFAPDSSDWSSGFRYNNRLRRQRTADWAFHIFVNDGSCDPDHAWPNTGASGYAIYQGPFAVMIHDRAHTPEWFSFVAAHETAHVFGAVDEYGYCWCGVPVGYLHIPQNNCYDCESQVPCMMDITTFELCEWTRGHLGWRDSDQDGALDPIDHPESGMAGWCGQGWVSDGDRIVIYDGVEFVKSVALSELNSHDGYIVWDGIDYKGDPLPPGSYTWYNHDYRYGFFDLIDDVEEPALLEADVIGNDGEQTLRIRFQDEDTHGCYVHADTYPVNDPELTSNRISDRFVNDRSGETSVDLPFQEEVAGSYELDLMMWDVGGGHNIFTTIPFVVNETSGVGEAAPASRLHLSRGYPNPAGRWVKWRLSGGGTGPVGLHVVDAGGRVVRRWTSRSFPEGTTTMLWDGRDDHGRDVPAGKYFLKIEDGQGSRVVESTVVVR